MYMFLAGPFAAYSNERHIRMGARWNQVCLIVAGVDNMEQLMNQVITCMLSKIVV